MRIIKKILLGLLILIVICCIISLFLPKVIKVERSTFIKAPHDLVFEQINNFHNWKSWSYWDGIDPNMVSEFSGPERGAGAKHSWKSDNKDVQYGSMTISRTTPDSILTELVFKDMPPSFGGWTVKDTAEGVNVSVYMNMNMGFFFNFLPGIFMDGWLGGDFEKSLAGLKNHAESLPAKTTSSAKEIKIEPATTPDMIFASYRTMTDTSKISADIGKSLMKVGRFTTKAGLKQAGPVFAIYHSYSPEKIDIECAVPVDKMARGEGDIKVTEWKAGNAVVAHYYGDYAGTGAAYELLKKWIADNNKKTTGPPWEVYVTDPGIEKDTAKWLTEVYFPIE